MKIACLARLTVALLLSAAFLATSTVAAPSVDSSQGLAGLLAQAGPLAQGWIVQSADNVCGLDDARMLSHPARVDYLVVLRLTPEMKRIREEGIDPASSRGIQLRQAAVDRVRRACDEVRRANRHCSVWKQIRHRDGRAVPDVTAKVKAKL